MPNQKGQGGPDLIEILKKIYGPMQDASTKVYREAPLAGGGMSIGDIINLARGFNSGPMPQEQTFPVVQDASLRERAARDVGAVLNPVQSLRVIARILEMKAGEQGIPLAKKKLRT